MKKIVLRINKIHKSIFETTIRREYNLNSQIDELLRKKELNMEEIQRSIVPIIENCDIFLSYSHRDIEVAQSVANQLMSYGYRVFIDSLFWDSIDFALKKYIKSIYKESYPYKEFLNATASFHMILVNSIMDTIDKCSIFLFLEGSDVNNNKTPSPWLYFENNVANHYDNELDIIQHRLFEDCKPILFPIKIGDFYRASTLEEVFNILE